MLQNRLKQANFKVNLVVHREACVYVLQFWSDQKWIA